MQVLLRFSKLAISTGIAILPMTTREHAMNQGQLADQPPAHLHPPDQTSEVKRAGPGPTAQPKTSTQPPAPRNSQLEDLHPVPTLDPCRGHAPGLGPGLDASLEVTDCPSEALFISEDVFVKLPAWVTSVLLSFLTFLVTDQSVI